MDKYNIIIPTPDLDALTIDMANWYNMNFNMRMRSNDDCMRIYGCTVPELYNNIKEKILKNEDIIDADSNNLTIDSSKDNIVKEYNYIIKPDEDTQYEDFDDKILMSRLLQNSPFIVILDPDIMNKEILDKKYNAFNSLCDKDKRISNDYSWQLWGFNVYDMYDKLNKQFVDLPDDFFTSNITKESSEIDKYTASLVDENFINHNRFYNHDPLFEANTYYGELESVKESKSKINVLSDRYSKIEENYKFPKYIPYMTESDIAKNKIDFRYNPKYASSLVQSYANEDVDMTLSLGWNPYIPLNKESLKEAYLNAANHIIDFWDLRKICNEECDSCQDTISAIYIIRSLIDTNLVGISFESSLDSIYLFNGIESSFKGFTKVSKADLINDNRYDNIDVSIIIVYNNTLKDVQYTCENLVNHEDIIPGFETVFGFIRKNYKNPYDPDMNKIILTQYIDIIVKLANIDLETFTFATKWTRIINNAKAYRIYIGKLSDYSTDRTNNLLNILSDPANINKVATANAMNESAKQFIVECITPVIIIESF